MCLRQLSWSNWLNLLLVPFSPLADKQKHEKSLIHFREEKAQKYRKVSMKESNHKKKKGKK